MKDRVIVWSVLLMGACSGRDPAPPPPLPTPTRSIASRPLTATKSGLSRATGDIGAAGPTIPLAAANDGSWVALCQARTDTDGVAGVEVVVGHHGDLHGDMIVPFFIYGGGPGIGIGRLVDVSTDTAVVAFTRASDLIVFDAKTGVMTTMPQPDLRGIRARGGPSALALSADGTKAVYFRPQGEGASIVIRELATEMEREVSLSHGIPFMVMPDETGPWARLLVVAKDTDRDGTLTLPERESSRPNTACRGEYASYSEWGIRGDLPKEMWLRLDTGQVVDDPNLIRPPRRHVSHARGR